MTAHSFYHNKIGKRSIENTASHPVRNKSLIHKVKSNQKFVLIIWISALILIVLSCTKRNEFAYPLIQTGEVTDIDSTGAVFHARFIDLSKEDILEYGFVWGLEKEPNLNSSKIVLPEAPEQGLIDIKISNDLYPDHIYYVRAFARNESYTTFGKVVSFTSMGSIIPEILDFNPKEGADGTRITITGKNFSGSVQGNIVNFGKIKAIIEEATTDELIVTLPESLDISGIVNITIKTANHVITSNETFYLYGCIISGFRPQNLIAGDELHIHATNISSVIAENSVSIGNIHAEILSMTNDTITVFIPYNVQSGLNEVSLTFNGKTCFATDSIMIKNPWRKIENQFSFVRSGAVGFSIAEIGYVGMGRAEYGGQFKDLWKYNFKNNTWLQCADLPASEREMAVAFSIGDKGYVCLGYNYYIGEFYKELYEYEPILDSWTKRADFPGVARQNSVSFVLGNRAYIGLGNGSGIRDLKDFWVYDSEVDEWSRLNDFPGTGSSSCTGFTFRDKGYVGLGISDGYIATREFWEYNSLSDSWTRKADFPGFGWEHVVSFTFDDYCYVGMGTNFEATEYRQKDFWRFDVHNNKWIRIADFPYYLNETTYFMVQNKGYITMGELIEFDPKK